MKRKSQKKIQDPFEDPNLTQIMKDIMRENPDFAKFVKEVEQNPAKMEEIKDWLQKEGENKNA